MEVASRTPPLVAGLVRAAAAGSFGIARTSLEMLSKLCLYSSQGYCLALQVSIRRPRQPEMYLDARLEIPLVKIACVII